MPTRPPHAHRAQILQHPVAFALRVLIAFRANQGLLLAGAVAYYTLLSLIPLLILILIGLSQLVDEPRLITMFTTYLSFAVPGHATALVEGMQTFLNQPQTIGIALSATMIVASATAFTVLENAVSVIFLHRVMIKRRTFLASALLPYLFILLLAIGLLVVTVASGWLELLGTRDITLFGMPHSLGAFAGTLVYAIGVVGEVLMLSAIYLIMPVGQVPWRHALLGGTVAAVLWEATRRVLAWYFGSASQLGVVYGSFATAIAIMLGVEVAAIVLLLGAQVIAEYERAGREPIATPPVALHTGPPLV